MGRGAQNGIVAALLAQQDFNTGINAIEYWARLVSPTVNMSWLNYKLSSKWELLDNTFKPYPCGIVIHPLIDGCLFFRKNGISPNDIEKLHVTVNPQCMRLCFIRHPKTALESIFSLYHGCAVALIYGKAGRKEFSDEICNVATVAEVRGKIEVTTDATMRDDEARLVAYVGGKQEEIYIEYAKGSMGNPLTQDELEFKFLDQSKNAIGLDKCKDIIDLCWELDKSKDIGELLELCRL